MKSVRTSVARVVLLTAVSAGMAMFVSRYGSYAYEYSLTLPPAQLLLVANSEALQ